MENHPIPQDITGFQFKLIGNMTIKQFAYLASFAVIAWILYSTALFPLVKFPLVFAFAGLGVALAFVPVEGRPLDVMISNFVKAMFTPTQFVYGKTGVDFIVDTPKPKHHKKTEEKVETQKVVAPFVEKKEEEKKELVYFQALANQGYHPQEKPTVYPVVQPHAFDNMKAQQDVSAQGPVDPKKEKEVEGKEHKLEEELALARKREKELADPALAKKAHEETIALEEELRTTIGEKEKLEQQLIELNRKLEHQKKTFYTPGVVEAPKETQKVRMVPKGLGNSVGLPITPDAPNVISGIVKDPRENPLPNILVEVKDQSGLPVRAFKTNGVGQFASATALTNGIYTIEFEDPKEENKFDAIQFEATGAIILPVEVISTDKREELRRELFN